MRFNFKTLSALACFWGVCAVPAAMAQDLSSVLSQNQAVEQLRSVTATDPSQPIPSSLMAQGTIPYGYRNPLLPAGANVQQQQQQLQPRSTSLEMDYSRRTGTTLKLFGRDFLSQAANPVSANTVGAAGNDYLVGIGDEFIVTVRGTPSRSWRVRVDREGRILLPDLAPIAAAGQPFGQVRATLEELAIKTWPGSQLYVSLGQVRQINVTVVGEVGNGSRSLQLSGFASVLDALTAAGGILPSGSLRQIRVIRAGQSAPVVIDLYGLLAGTASPSLALADGDRIIVPPLGRTVAISGDVALPGIFELPAGTEAISSVEAVRLAGGLLRPQGNRFLHLAFDSQGHDRTTETRSVARLSLRASDILLVTRSANAEVGQVSLAGHVRVPGIRSLALAPTVRDLIGDPTTLALDPYLPFAALLTTDPTTLVRHFVPVDLGRALAGTGANPALHGDDVLVVLSMADIRYLGSADVQAVLQGGGPVSATGRQALSNGPPSTSQSALQSVPPQFPAQPGFYPRGDVGFSSTLPSNLPAPPPELARAAGILTNSQDPVTDSAITANPANNVCGGLRSLSAVQNSGRASRFANAVVPAAEGRGDVQSTALQNVLSCPAIFDRYPTLLPFVLEYAVALGGEVRQPGVYPVTGSVTLDAIVSASGDVTRQADLSNIELTRFADNQSTGQAAVTRNELALNRAQFASLIVRPGDVIRFSPIYEDRDDGPVTISGEVKRPGSYEILRGEKLSSLLQRAGGLGSEAFPYGAVLTRQRIKEQERANVDRAIKELQSGLSAAITSGNPDRATSANSGIQALITQLRQAQPVGRVVIEADPEQLIQHPERDIILEPGDILVMPKRPDWVTISGEVLNPSSQQFRPELRAADYIEQSGGITYNADKAREFFVLPNGTAQPVRSSFWNFKAQPIPPGSVIFVPRDLSPDILSTTKDITSILSSLAIGAASLVVIGHN